jgi:hypothetical protein
MDPMTIAILMGWWVNGELEEVKREMRFRALTGLMDAEMIEELRQVIPQVESMTWWARKAWKETAYLEHPLLHAAVQLI